MNFRHLTYLIFLLTFFITYSTQQIYPCAYTPEPNRTSITFFNPDLFTDSTYRACYLDASYYMPDEYYAPSEIRYKVNLLEWQRYFNGEADIAALTEVIYNTKAETLENEVLPVFVKNLPPNREITKNKFLSLLYQRKDLETLQYLIFAKRCEPQVQSGLGYWSEPERDAAQMENLVKKGLKAYDSTYSSFLKLRYAFQIVRLLHYSGKYTDCIEHYDRLITPLQTSKQDNSVSNSLIAGWALALKAGALLHSGYAADAMYQFSKVFELFPQSRELAIRNFTYGNEDIWQQMLDLGKTPDEKANLWLLRALQNTTFDLDPLKEICDIAPNSVLAEIELIRQVNLIERYWLTPKLTEPMQFGEELFETDFSESETSVSFWQKVKSFFKKIWQSIRAMFGISEKTNSEDDSAASGYSEELKEFALTFLKKHQVPNSDLWHTVAAYMSYLQKNYRQCYQLLDKVTGANKKVQQQANLVYALARLEESGTLDPELESLFVYALQGLPQPEYEYDNYGIFSRVLTKLATTYLQNGNTALAVLCFDKAKETSTANAILDFYSTDAGLDSLLSLVNQPQKTPFESFLLNNSRFSVPFLKDVKATKLMRKLHFEEALKIYKEIPKTYWEKKPDEDDYYYENYNHFFCDLKTDSSSILNRIYDWSNENHEMGESELQNEADTVLSCNKMEFADRIVQLERKAVEAPHSADLYYYEIAGGFFNTPFWGYNGAIWEGSLVSTLNYYFDYTPGYYPVNIPGIAEKIYEAEKQFIAEYGTREVAISYYEKVMKMTKNQELAAQSAYLSALSKQEPLSTLHEGDFKDKTHLKLLSDKYQNTAFYRYISRTCPGIGEF